MEDHIKYLKEQLDSLNKEKDETSDILLSLINEKHDIDINKFSEELSKTECIETILLPHLNHLKYINGRIKEVLVEMQKYSEFKNSEDHRKDYSLYKEIRNKINECSTKKFKESHGIGYQNPIVVVSKFLKMKTEYFQNELDSFLDCFQTQYSTYISESWIQLIFLGNQFVVSPIESIGDMEEFELSMSKKPSETICETVQIESLKS